MVWAVFEVNTMNKESRFVFSRENIALANEKSSYLAGG